MSSNCISSNILQKALDALLQRIRRALIPAPEEDQPDHSIISISTNRFHL